jgi:hypothetical protein
VFVFFELVRVVEDFVAVVNIAVVVVVVVVVVVDYLLRYLNQLKK